MIISRTHLRNFCQHRDRLLEFSPRLNLIVGGNGAGKTNLLNGMLYGLTGVDRNVGTIADNVCDFRGRGEPSFVHMDVLHAGQPMTIMRQLKPTTLHEVRIGNDAAIQTPTQVNEAVLRVLETTRSRLEDYIFIKQRGLDSWIDKQPADRAREVSALFGIEKANRIWEDFGPFISGIEVPSLAIDEDTTIQKHGEALAALQQLQTRMATEFSDVPVDAAASVAQWQQTIDLRSSYAQQEATVNQARTNLAEAEAEAVRAREDLVLAREDLAVIAAAVLANEPMVAEARAGLACWATYDQTATLRQQYSVRHRTFWQGYRGRPGGHPKQPTNFVVRDEAWWAVYAPLQQQAAELDGAIRALRSIAEGNPCPTCGNPANNLQQRLLSLEEARAQLAVSFTPLEEARQASETYEAAFVASHQARKTFRDTVHRLRADRDTIRGIAQPTAARDVLNKIVADHTALVTDQQNSQGLLTSANTTANTTTVRLQQKQQALQNAETVLAGLQVVTAEAAQQAMQLRDQLQGRLTQRAELQGQVSAQQASVAGYQRQLDDIQLTKRRQQRTRDAIASLTRTRAILHHNEAPRVVSFTYLEQMSVAINEALMLFDAPFTIVPDDKLSFQADFLDGRKRKSDRRLSVGERIVLALAFRMTVNSTFAGSLGLLVMDEPTAGLDENNLGCLPRALDRLRDVSQDSGLQVFFVTHEPRIAQYFDTVIQIE